MRDLGYQGNRELGSTLPLGIVCLNASDVPTEPTGTPSYEIYGPGSDTAIHSGTLAGLPGAETGARADDVVLSAGNGFAANASYFIIITYVVTAVTYKAVASLQIQ